MVLYQRYSAFRYMTRLAQTTCSFVTRPVTVQCNVLSADASSFVPQAHSHQLCKLSLLALYINIPNHKPNGNINGKKN